MHPAFRRCLSFAATAVSCLSCCVGYSAQSTPATDEPTLQQRPTLRITTREILLDVVVSDYSRSPVMGLKASDFTVTEEGEAQRITSLEEHHPTSASDWARLNVMPSLSPNTFTNFTPVPYSNAYTVILLDAMDSPIDAQMYLREQLISFIKNMRPGTPIAIFQLDSEMRLVQGFSSDPQVLLEAARSKRDAVSLNKPSYGSREMNLSARNMVLGQGMQSMGQYLAGFPGRKNLIWFTGKVPIWGSDDDSDLVIANHEGHTFRDDSIVLDDGISGLTDALTLSRVAVYPIDARGLMTDPGFSAQSRTPGGAGFGMAVAANGINLDRVAEATGGKAYYNTNGLKDILAEIVDNGSNYYTLAYSTTNQKWNGEFRRIQITVNRPGVKLQYRPGYLAIDRSQQEQRQLALLQWKIANSVEKRYRPVNETNQERQDKAVVHRPKNGFDAAMELAAIPPTEIIFTAKLSTDDKVVKLSKKMPLPKDNFLLPEYKGKPFRSFSVQINAGARELSVVKSSDGVRHGAVQCVTAVYTQDGEIINALQTTAVFDLGSESYRKLLQNGLLIRQQIAVPVKGNYFLRIGVHDLGNDHVGALEIPVDAIRPRVAGEATAEP